MIFKIKGKEYDLKYKLRALFIFEEITKKAFAVTTMYDLYIFFYSTILASYPEFDVQFEEFTDICTEDPRLE